MLRFAAVATSAAILIAGSVIPAEAAGRQNHDPSATIARQVSDLPAVAAGAKSPDGVTIGFREGRSTARTAGVQSFADVAHGADGVVRQLKDGVQAIAVLENADASDEVSFAVGGPNVSLVSDALGGVIVEEGGVAVGRIGAPWAYDATGKSLATSYAVDGNTIVQRIDTTGATYPVVADPHYTWGIITGTVYFNKSETAKIALSAAFIAGLGAFAPPPFDIMFVASAGYFSLVAGWSVADGKCLKIKTQTGAYEYSGGYCK